jgi:hypothetical protein
MESLVSVQSSQPAFNGSNLLIMPRHSGDRVVGGFDVVRDGGIAEASKNSNFSRNNAVRIR